MMAERKHDGGRRQSGLGRVFLPALGELSKPIPFNVRVKAAWISLECPYLEVLNYEVFFFGKNIIIESATGIASAMV